MEYRLPLQELQYRIATHPDKPYLHQPQNRVWRSLTWADVDEQARRIAKGLLDQGFQPGDRIALLGKNSPEWFIADFAIAMAGLVSVPIYTTAGVQTIEHVLSHSGARAIFLGALENTEAAEQALLPGLPRIALPEAQLPCEHQWRGWIEKHPALEKTVDAAPSDTMTLVYTSGSTGLPKGVVLTHKNIAASADACANDFALTPDDRCMSYLPLAHITERCAVEWASVYGGDEIYFTESLDTFVDDVKHARPTLFISVPRLWTRFQAGVLAKMPDNKLQRLLKIPLVSGFVARKIRKNLGLDNCRLAGSGSAPISPSILRWYHRLGVNICEGWGMTETSGMACAAIPFEASTIGSIGRPISCVEMKLSDEDEILIRGDSVFTEYYKNPEATAEVFSNDWFHTGDCASLDDKGVYRIIGRVKEQFKTGKGKYVAPVPIESMLGRNADIELVCVLGSGRKQPVAMVVLGEHLSTRDEKTHQTLHDTVVAVNAELESHQQLDHIIVSDESWTVENDLLTPTLKIRRNKLEERYREIIEKDHPEVVIWL